MIKCDQLLKVYTVDETDVVALQGLELVVEPGERVGVIGASGSGKSTLLNIIGGLDTPTAGHVEVAGLDLTAQASLESYRATTVGFVWQQTGRNLLPYLSAIDNVALPMRALRRPNPTSRARELLALVGMSDRAEHTPVQLSGGQQQRVAIAVAIANDPTVLLADEPTGELDTETANDIYALLEHLTEQTGLTQLIVSHDPELARHVDRVVTVRDGRVASEHRHLAGSPGASVVEQRLTLDRFGRLQLDEEQREVLGGGPLVEATIDGDEVRLARPRHRGRSIDEASP